MDLLDGIHRCGGSEDVIIIPITFNCGLVDNVFNEAFAIQGEINGLLQLHVLSGAASDSQGTDLLWVDISAAEIRYARVIDL